MKSRIDGKLRVRMAIVMAMLWGLSSARPAWGQWATGSGGIYYNGGNVGIGANSLGYKLEVVGNLRVRDANGAYYGWGLSTDASANFDLSYSAGFAQHVIYASYYTGNVGIGTSNPGTYKLAVEGKLGARDVIVTSSPWADYVFQPGYHLRPLRELNAYIQQYHHLPEIPTEAEVKEKGVSVGEMQAKLLAKVEELTLHMIQAEERNVHLEQQNHELRDRVVKLEHSAATQSVVR